MTSSASARLSGSHAAIATPGRVIVPPGFSHPRLRLATFMERQIVLFDLRGIRDEMEAVAIISGPYRRFMDAQRAGAGLLTLVETRETPHSAKAVAAFRDFAHQNTPYVKAAAVVAAPPMHRLAVTTIAMFTKRNIKAFADDVTAMEWLVEQ